MEYISVSYYGDNLDNGEFYIRNMEDLFELLELPIPEDVDSLESIPKELMEDIFWFQNDVLEWSTEIKLKDFLPEYFDVEETDENTVTWDAYINANRDDNLNIIEAIDQIVDICDIVMEEDALDYAMEAMQLKYLKYYKLDKYTIMHEFYADYEQCEVNGLKYYVYYY